MRGPAGCFGRCFVIEQTVGKPGDAAGRRVSSCEMSRALYVLGLVGAASLAFGTAGATRPDQIDPRTQDEAGSILAWFDRRSYAPGDLAMLHFLRGAPAQARLTVLRVGSKRGRRSSQTEMAGAVVRIKGARVVTTANVASLQIGAWPSGLSAARVTASGGRRGFAPFVVTAGRKPRSRVVVVLPTNTWQAYNFRDADKNGVGDTWYADPIFLRSNSPDRTCTAGFLRTAQGSCVGSSGCVRGPTSCPTTTSTPSRTARPCSAPTTSSCSPVTRST